jgi:hypothetical protein
MMTIGPDYIAVNGGLANVRSDGPQHNFLLFRAPQGVSWRLP